MVGTVKDEDQIKPRLTPLVFKGPLSTFQAPSDRFGESRDSSSRSTSMGGWGEMLRTLFPRVLIPSLGTQSRRTRAARATPSPPGPARGLASGTRLVPPRATHRVPRRPRWRAAASDSAGSGANRIPSSWASPWWALAFARSRGVWRMRDAGCGAPWRHSARGRCQSCHCRWGPSTVVLRGGHARLLPPPFAAAPGPTSEGEGGASRRGGARGAIRSPWAPSGAFPPEELLTLCDSTPVSLGTHSPGRVRRDLIWDAFLPWASGLRATRRDTQCDFRAALGMVSPT